MSHTTEVVVVVGVTSAVRNQCWHTRDRSGDVLVVHTRSFWVDARVSVHSTAVTITGARATVSAIITCRESVIRRRQQLVVGVPLRSKQLSLR